MSGSLQRNLESLASRYPELKALKSEQAQSSAIEVRQQNGALELWKEASLIDSSENHFDFESSSVDRVFFLQGFGLGFGLQALLSADLPNLTDIIVIEPDAGVFKESLKQTDFKELFSNKNIHWLVGDQVEQIFSFLMKIFRCRPEIQRMEAFRFVEHPQITSPYRHYFDQFKLEWERARAQIYRQLGNLEDSLLGLKNTFLNRDWLRETPGIESLRDQFKDLPALVVSAGPSLRQSLPLLKSLQNKFLIIANDATLSVLQNHRIDAHFVCSLERVMGAKKFFEALDPEKTKSFLVTYPIVPQSVIEAFPGKSFSCLRDYSYHLYLEKNLSKGVLASSSSVAHLCVRLADFLGCPQIYLIGQDLAYDPSSFQSHVDGVAYEAWSKPSSPEEIRKGLSAKNHGDLIELECNFGGKVFSNPILFSYLKEFAFESSRTQAELINATEGGAKIPGLKWLPFSELAKNLSSRADSPDLFAKIESLRTSEEAGFDWEPLSEYLEGIGPRLQEFSKQSQEMAQEATMDLPSAREVFKLINQFKLSLESSLIFVSFVLEMNALDHVRIENKRSQIGNALAQSSDVREQFACLAEWFSSMAVASHRVLAQIQSR